MEATETYTGSLTSLNNTVARVAVFSSRASSASTDELTRDCKVLNATDVVVEVFCSCRSSHATNRCSASRLTIRWSTTVEVPDEWSFRGSCRGEDRAVVSRGGRIEDREPRGGKLVSWRLVLWLAMGSALTMKLKNKHTM